MAHFGISIDSGRFEIIADGEAIGPRRDLDAQAVAALEGFALRYGVMLRTRTGGAGAVLALGKELYRWLDGDRGQLAALVERAPRPFLLEVRGPGRPSAAEWALLRAPFELLADEEGFLAQDALLRFCPLRRLGPARAAPPPDRHRLGLVFMAAAPRGEKADDLDYEAEETAILAAVSARSIDLVVEESGDPVELGRRLRELDTMQAVHLSCHGLNRWVDPKQPKTGPKPILLMEDQEGGGRPTDAVELLREVRPTPRLLFLSACLSAAGADRSHAPGFHGDKGGEAGGAAAQVAHSLATALVEAGMPAVLGWEGSVADVAATQFAAHCYAALAKEMDLGEAVAEGRRALLGSEHEGIRNDWHLARLWLGPEGGGAIVGGDRKRSLLPRSHGHKVFLDAKQQVPVAAPEMFVGRRRQLQRALRSLRGDQHAGVLLQGPGRRGKSSLAARIVSRCQDRMVPAVLFEHYDALSLVEVLENALQPWPAARELVRQRKAGVREDKARLGDLLTDLLCGPCREAGDGTKPLLLIIDDLERILEADPAGGRHKVQKPEAEVLAVVLQAFDPHRTDSRLIVTSRYPFSLDGLEEKLLEIPLPPLSEASQKKLELRQRTAALEADRLPPDLAARLELLPEVREVARGNPGLQDLIGQKLVLSKEVPHARAQAALAQMKSWLEGGDLPEEAAVREFLEVLTIDTLLDLAGASGRDLLGALRTLDLPVPVAVVDAVADEIGGAVVRLCDLGLLDVLEDLVDHRKVALAVNALAAGRLPAPSAALETAVAKPAVGPLFAAWGGRSGLTIVHLQLARLGLRAGDAAFVAASAVGAMQALRGGKADERARLGQHAIALLEANGREVPWRLISLTAAAVATMGEGKAADALFDKGVAALETKRLAGEEVDPFEAAYLLFEQGKRLAGRGELDEAERLFNEAAELAGKSGNEASVAIARGQIANVLERRGALDEALRIRTEEQLPVFERLGEVREVAITKGQIADILESRGALDEALRIRTEEQLPVFERLGEVRAVAIAKGKIADILFSRGALDEALRIRTEEQLPVYQRLGEVRAVAIAKGQIADILFSRGALDEALRIRTEEQLPVLERLGEVREVAIAKGRIADILESRGALDEALRIRTEEELPILERLGDVREVAVTKGKIAHIRQEKGDLEGALAMHLDCLAMARELEDIEGIAHGRFSCAQIRLARGDHERGGIQTIFDELSEAYAISLKLQRPDFIGGTGALLGQVLAMSGHRDEGVDVLATAAAAFEKIGQDGRAGQCRQLIEQIRGSAS